MNGITIFIITIIGIFFLGKYALNEGQKIERQKKFTKNMKNYEDRRKDS